MVDKTDAKMLNEIVQALAELPKQIPQYTQSLTVEAPVYHNTLLRLLDLVVALKCRSAAREEKHSYIGHFLPVLDDAILRLDLLQESAVK